MNPTEIYRMLIRLRLEQEGLKVDLVEVKEAAS